MKKLSFNLKSFLFTTVLFTIVCMLLSSCSTSHGTTSHGWGMENKCGKKKPGKWQRTSSYNTNRDGSVNCSAFWDANPEVSVTPIGEDSLCVSFTFYQD